MATLQKARADSITEEITQVLERRLATAAKIGPQELAQEQVNQVAAVGISYLTGLHGLRQAGFDADDLDQRMKDLFRQALARAGAILTSPAKPAPSVLDKRN